MENVHLDPAENENLSAQDNSSVENNSPTDELASLMADLAAKRGSLAESGETTTPSQEEAMDSTVAIESEPVTPIEEMEVYHAVSVEEPVESVAEEHEDFHEEVIEEELLDVSQYTKSDLVEILKKMASGSITAKVDANVKRIKERYDHLVSVEREEALSKFLEEGGEEADFRLRMDEAARTFESLYKGYREAFKAWRQEIDRSRNKALDAKKKLLDRLKDLVDGPTPSTNLDELRNIQKEWKEAGAVPQNYVRDLNATYHSLVDRFFSNREIYKELRDLDRQRNLESKKAIVERAEKLLDAEIVVKAIKEYKDLQEEYMQIGLALNKDENEALYVRIKAVGDALFEKRRNLQAEQQTKFLANLESKKALLDKVIALETWQSDKVTEWNQKSDELRAMQAEWVTIGPVTTEAENQELRKNFWNAIKKFFRNKAAFIKKLDDERAKNKEAKLALVEEATALSETEDFNQGTAKFKELQEKWKTIGPAPRKEEEQLYKKFKEAGDKFFEAKRASHAAKDQVFFDNMTAKFAIIDEIKASSSWSVDGIHGLLNRYSEVGFVPRDKKDEVQRKLIEAVDAYLAEVSGISEFEKAKIKIDHGVVGGGSIRRDSGNRRSNDRRQSGGYQDRQGNSNDPLYPIRKQESAVKGKIADMESQISLWQNNLTFFANSRNADALKLDVQNRIDGMNKDLDKLKSELKLIQSEIRTLQEAAQKDKSSQENNS